MRKNLKDKKYGQNMGLGLTYPKLFDRKNTDSLTLNLLNPENTDNLTLKVF